MHRKEINERSPLRVLENSIHGGLGRGNLGVVVSRQGVGKTAFLVGIALDDLMRGRNVLHICLDQPLEKARAFYDEIFIDLSHAQALEDVWRVRLDVERHRRIYAFPAGQFSPRKLGEVLGFLREHGDFAPAAIIIDGCDFDQLKLADLVAFRGVGQQVDAEIWMSAVTNRERSRNDRGAPEPVAHLETAIDVILEMAHEGRTIHVHVLKDHDNPRIPELQLALDPTTMLLVRE